MGKVGRSAILRLGGTPTYVRGICVAEAEEGLQFLIVSSARTKDKDRTVWLGKNLDNFMWTEDASNRV